MPSDSVSDGAVTVDEWESCGGSAVEWLVDAEGSWCRVCGMDPVSASHLARHAYRGSGRLVDVERNAVMGPDDAWDVMHGVIPDVIADDRRMIEVDGRMVLV